MKVEIETKKCASTIIAQRLSQFETFHLWSLERLDMLTVFSAEKSTRYVEQGKR